MLHRVIFSTCMNKYHSRMDRKQKHYYLAKDRELSISDESDDIDIEYLDSVGSEIDQIYI